MTRRFEYDDRPEAQNVPLRLDEVEALILNGGAILSRDQGRLVHFLQRVVATLKDQAARIGRLQADVEAIRTERSVNSHPMARAVQALADLDEEGRRQLLDHGYLLELEKLRKAQEEAEMVKLGAVNETNRVRAALAQMLEDPSIPPDVKQHVRLVLAAIGYRY